jgi:hypothetical protein
MSIATLQTVTQNQLVSVMSTAFAAQSNKDIRDGIGEPLGDMWSAFALASLIISQNLIYVNNNSRLLTSGNVSGASPNLEFSATVDSFVNVFGVYRIASAPSVGTVTFTPISASTTSSYIQVGTLTQTASGTQFIVVADSGQTAYTASGYLIPAGSLTAISITVQCLTAGVSGNVAANTIVSLVSGLGSTTPLNSYVVTNPQGFTNGSAGETDQALATRFQNVFQSGRWATRLAIATAIAGSGVNLTYQIAEGVNAANAATVGFFTVFVNIIGSNSSTPNSVLTSVSNAVNLVKALGISYTVVAPTLSAIPAIAVLHVDPNYILIPGNTLASVQTAANAAYSGYVNNIGLSLTNTTTLLSYAKVSAVLVTVPGVLNVSGFTLNGGTTDITAPFGTQFVAGTSTFTSTTS